MRALPALAALLLLAATAVPLGEAPVRFLVLGDTGSGGAGQYKVAAAAVQVCAALGCDFAIVNGDNIYDNGVESPHDPQFEAKFELPYADLAIPFYLALGNHDNGGTLGDGDGSENYRGDFQVAYSYRTDRLSDKWHMPSRYHTFRQGEVQLWALDTNPLMYWGGLPLPGQPLWMGIDPLGLDQLEWLRGSLAASDARWKFAFAHHPYITNGQHGDAGFYEGVPTLGLNIKLFVEQGLCGAADFYSAGHDHDLQWLKATEGCAKTEFIVSGAASKPRPLADPDGEPAWFQLGDTLGFFWVQVQGDTFTGRVYDGDGALRFERSFAKAG